MNPDESLARVIEDNRGVKIAAFLGVGDGGDVVGFLGNIAAKVGALFCLIIEKDVDWKSKVSPTLAKEIETNERIDIFAGYSIEELNPLLQAYFMGKGRFCLSPALRIYFSEKSLGDNADYYERAAGTLFEAARQIILSYGDSPEDSMKGLENMFANLEVILGSPGINRLENAFEGKPGIVVSAGPSLNKTKQFLKGHEDKAVICACDATLKILMDMGIHPLFATSLERTTGILPMFQFGGLNEYKGYICSCPVIPPDIYRAYTGRQIIVYRNFDHFKWLPVERGIINVQLSTGNMAFKLLEYCGCDPIIIIGQDLSFGAEGESHAEGMACGTRVKTMYERGEVMIPGNDVPLVKSNYSWLAMLRAFEYDIANYKGVAINATAGGARIAGATYMGFDNALNTYCTETIETFGTVEQRLSGFSPQEEERKAVEEKSLKALKDLKHIYQQCLNGLKKVGQWQGKLSKMENKEKAAEKFPEILHDCHKPRKEIFAKYNYTFQHLLMHSFQSYNNKFEIDAMIAEMRYKDQTVARIETAMSMAGWYSVLADLTKITMNTLERRYNNDTFEISHH